jgi:protein TonB
MQPTLHDSTALSQRAGSSVGSTHFLCWGILLSIVVHLAILAWQRQIAAPVRPPVAALEIVMMNAATESAPVRAQVLAQVNSDGGGQATNGVASSDLPYIGQVPESIVLERLVKQRLQLETEQQQLLTQLKSQQLVAEGRPLEQFLNDAQLPGHDERDQEQILMNNTLAALSEQVQQYNQLPRKYFDAPSAHKARFVEYVDHWRQRIEQIGTQQYPTGSEGKAYGSVQASLTIRSDGVVIDVNIDRPSDQPLLNQAVKRIAQLASPFPPFPREMAEQIDQIVLTRTWHFVDGALKAEQP